MAHEMLLPALGYLTEWLETDEPCRIRLCAAVISKQEGAATDGAKALADFATVYQVHRTFKICDEPSRLRWAFDEIKDFEHPSDRDSVIRTVCEYTKRLSARYGKDAYSAASKFLWLRFLDPVKIYDSLVWTWLNKHERRLRQSGTVEDWYPDYYDAWTDAYDKNERLIADACSRLKSASELTAERSNPDERSRLGYRRHGSRSAFLIATC